MASKRRAVFISLLTSLYTFRITKYLFKIYGIAYIRQSQNVTIKAKAALSPKKGIDLELYLMPLLQIQLLFG